MSGALQRAAPDNSEAEIDALKRTCERLSGFDRDISLEWADGFLCGLAAGPRLPATDDWLLAMCDDAFERSFADPQDRAEALQTLQARLDVLCAQLDPEALFDDPEQLRLNPIVIDWTDAERERVRAEAGLSAEEAAVFQTGSEWASGVLDAVDAFPALWELPPDEDAATAFGAAFAQIAALLLAPDSDELKAHVAEFHPDGPVPTRDDLLSEACFSGQDLRMFWIDFAPRPETRRIGPTPGRNDPCPCGSGKKYKKCHGAG